MESETRRDCRLAVQKFSQTINNDCPNGKLLYVGNAGDPNPKGEYSVLFDKNKFQVFSMDVDGKWGADIVGDITKSELPDNYASCIVIVQVLEHVPNLWDFPKEASRLLCDGGYMIADTPFMYKFHAEPEFGDYWRLTKQGMEILFRDYFDIVDIYATDFNTSCLLRKKKLN